MLLLLLFIFSYSFFLTGWWLVPTRKMRTFIKISNAKFLHGQKPSYSRPVTENDMT